MDAEELPIVLLQQHIITYLQSEIASQTVWYRATREANVNLRSEVDVLRAAEARFKAEATPKAHQVDRLLADNSQLETENARLKADNQALSLTSAQSDVLIANLAEQNIEIDLLKGENAELKARLNESKTLIDSMSDTMGMMEDAMLRTKALAQQDALRLKQVDGALLTMTRDLKQEKETSAVLSTAIRAMSHEPVLKVEGKGQLHLLDVNDVGIYADLKSMLGTNGSLWIWVDIDGYGHPVGLNEQGDLVTGTKSATYFSRRIGKAARVELIDTLLRFDKSYFDTVLALVMECYAELCINGTRLKEDIVALVKGLELLPEREVKYRQLAALQSKLSELKKQRNTAVTRFRARLVSGVKPTSQKKTNKRKRK
ncbi:hypothetical protein [Edwardsiella tarda]|uniref:hypothetical protein n=1 Tax=Edwardsiella tarda TaxID=636 RepID=UPI00126706D9|nr:hypothetical protein [Edwardsiella tarda]